MEEAYLLIVFVYSLCRKLGIWSHEALSISWCHYLVSFQGSVFCSLVDVVHSGSYPSVVIGGPQVLAKCCCSGIPGKEQLWISASCGVYWLPPQQKTFQWFDGLTRNGNLIELKANGTVGKNQWDPVSPQRRRVPGGWRVRIRGPHENAATSLRISLEIRE